jgi:hypothetical protein
MAGLTTINELSVIPSFRSEAEEADFWGTHTLSEDLWGSLPAADPSGLPAPRPRPEVMLWKDEGRGFATVASLMR